MVEFDKTIEKCTFESEKSDCVGVLNYSTKKSFAVTSRTFNEKLAQFHHNGSFYRFSSSIDVDNPEKGKIYGTSIVNFGFLEPKETGCKYTLFTQRDSKLNFLSTANTRNAQLIIIYQNILKL